MRAPSPVTRTGACVHYVCFIGQHKVASSDSRGQWSVAVLITSFAILVCVGVNQGHYSLMGAQWLGCLYRPSTMQKVRDTHQVISSILSYHSCWCSYWVRVSWSYLSFDTKHMYWLTLVYTQALNMYVRHIIVCSMYTCSVRSCCLCIIYDMSYVCTYFICHMSSIICKACCTNGVLLVIYSPVNLQVNQSKFGPLQGWETR